jgi:hypothetical protein
MSAAMRAHAAALVRRVRDEDRARLLGLLLARPALPGAADVAGAGAARGVAVHDQGGGAADPLAVEP